MTNLFAQQSSPKDQWIMSRVNDPSTKQMWHDIGLNPGPNQSLAPGQSVPFMFSPEGPRMMTDQADQINDTPWELIGLVWEDSFGVSTHPVNENFQWEVHEQGFFESLFNSSWFWFWFTVSLFCFMMYLLRRRATKWRRVNHPVYAGEPMSTVALTDATALAAMEAQANRLYPGVKCNIKNIRKGRFFGEGMSYFADKPKGVKCVFDGQVGYAATLSRPGAMDEEVYTLLQCGNDARNGEYMTGLIFHEDAKVDSEKAIAAAEQAKNQNPPFDAIAFSLELIKTQLADEKGQRNVSLTFEDGKLEFKLESHGQSPYSNRSER
ncbi:MAG: hypothetical protein AAB438_01210 [Patescibacteria group bacterium]